MLSIDKDIVVHKLNINIHFVLQKEKTRVFDKNKVHAMKDEVRKFLKANFIHEVDYPTWLANIVMVKKATCKWQMCAEFTNLNKAHPKGLLHASLDWCFSRFNSRILNYDFPQHFLWISSYMAE